MTLAVPEPREGDPGPWTFDPPALASMLAIELVKNDDGARYQVGLSGEQMGAFLGSIAADLTVEPVNARFIFNDETRELDPLESAVIGRRLNIEESLQSINQKLAAGEHTIALVFNYQEPAVSSDATAAELGITELVSAETSYFYGSSSARIQNIQTASSRFHGLLVAPGETFSMAEVLGDVSLDTGYAEALIIFGDRTIQGVGGGVCQVSTTLFRTVFFGGLPVVERHPHAYRVYYYELTASNNVNTQLAGLDATVYVPLVDFKFTNDSPNWLLMETYVNAAGRSLTWKFYSTSDGRQVDWTSTGLRDKVEPPDPLYQENPELDKGEIKQVDWAVEGAEVTVTRTVTRNGEIYLQDTFYTHYVPWRAVYEYGPGTEDIPTPEPTGEPEG
jgi:vancomycin resistance protein YoaR